MLARASTRRLSLRHGAAHSFYIQRGMAVAAVATKSKGGKRYPTRAKKDASGAAGDAPLANADEIKVNVQSWTHEQIFHPEPVVKLDTWTVAMAQEENVNTFVSLPASFVQQPGLMKRLPNQLQRETEFFHNRLGIMARASVLPLLQTISDGKFPRVVVGGGRKTGKSTILLHLAAHFHSHPDWLVMYVPSVRPYVDGRFAFSRSELNPDKYDQPAAMQQNLALFLAHNQASLRQMPLKNSLSVGKRSWTAGENTMADVLVTATEDLTATPRIHAHIMQELKSTAQPKRVLLAVDHIDVAMNASTEYRDTDSQPITTSQLTLVNDLSEFMRGTVQLSSGGVFVGAQSLRRSPEEQFAPFEQDALTHKFTTPNYSRAEIEEALKYYSRAGFLNRGEVTPEFVEQAIFMTESVPGELFRFCSQRFLL